MQVSSPKQEPNEHDGHTGTHEYIVLHPELEQGLPPRL